MNAMIFAAGLGTRLQPITNTKPKALAEINGIPLLEITIKRLLKFGFTKIVVNVHHYPHQIRNFLINNNNFGAEIHISDESEQLLDTGGGLKHAAHFFTNNEPVLVHNVDIVSNIDLSFLYNKHIENKTVATLAGVERKASREFLINHHNQLCGWRNTATGEVIEARLGEPFLKALPFTGIHVVSPEFFDLISEKGVFSIVQVYLRLAASYNIMMEPFKDIVWMDLGTPEKLSQAACFAPELGIGT